MLCHLRPADTSSQSDDRGPYLLLLERSADKSTTVLSLCASVFPPPLSCRLFICQNEFWRVGAKVQTLSFQLECVGTGISSVSGSRFMWESDCGVAPIDLWPDVTEGGADWSAEQMHMETHIQEY